MSKAKNRFDVQVAFPGFSFGIKNMAEVELTPEQVATELEEFCVRIRNVIAHARFLEQLEQAAAS